jgi:hypothetical protein
MILVTKPCNTRTASGGQAMKQMTLSLFIKTVSIVVKGVEIDGYILV